MSIKISRRNVLRGAGVCIALPWMEALAPRAARAQAAYPQRFIPIFFPNGTAEYWRPAGEGEGAAWQLSPILEPFAPIKEKVSVLTNLQSYSACLHDGQITPVVNPSHARLPGTTLTCVDSDAVRDDIKEATGSRPAFANGVSIDQLIAQNIPQQTALQSMQVGLSTIESYCDGRHCSLSQSISWSAPEEPMYKDVNPQTVFDRLVSAGAVDSDPTTMGPDPVAVAAAERRKAMNLSVLDGVTQSANSLNPQLTTSDKLRLDQFLTSLRELEQRVSNVGSNFGSTVTLGCSVTQRPTMTAGYGLANTPGGYDKAAHADVMNDLIVMALQCDITRIISYMLDDARSEFEYTHVVQRQFSETGSADGNGGTCGNFHGAQHGGATNNNFSSINHWLTQKVCELAQKIDAIEEGDGTLLDHALMVYMSPMHGGNHQGDFLPVALIGGGGGVFKTNQHVVYPEGPDDRAIRDLYFTIANQYYDLGLTSFGNENRPGITNQLMTEILA